MHGTWPPMAWQHVLTSFSDAKTILTGYQGTFMCMKCIDFMLLIETSTDLSVSLG